MTHFPFDAVGFDLDGTLLDTHRDLGAAVNHALGEGGFAPVPVEHIESLIGGGAKLMLARALEERGGVADDDGVCRRVMLRVAEADEDVVRAGFRRVRRRAAVKRDVRFAGIASANLDLAPAELRADARAESL